MIIFHPSMKQPNPSHFDDLIVPTSCLALAGYAWLIHHHGLKVPTPDRLCAIVAAKNTNKNEGRWHLLGSRYQPKEDWFSHLVFALKYEGIDLLTLKSLFSKLSQQQVISKISNEITGSYSRRIWFLYEWLLEKKLPIDDAKSGGYVNVIDEGLQFACNPKREKRQRVNNNLPGTSQCCFLIRKTPLLIDWVDQNLAQKALEQTGQIHPDLISRAAAFLLLADSKASYTIEGEQPPHSRIERWGKIIGTAGETPFSVDEIEHLQDEVIPDSRFIFKGLRAEGGFIGSHDRLTNHPLPEHISAKPDDLLTLIEGLLTTYDYCKHGGLHPILTATVLAFAFVFIHPLEDGNGRIHRYLIHHALAEQNFSPSGLIFPVSAVILERISEYKTTLEQFTQRRMALIEWQPTDTGNVHVTNDTIDLYRYGDFTAQAEFLFDCVKTTIEKVLPDEVDYLKRYDELWRYIGTQFDMPQKKASLLINFLQQGKGKLSQRAKQKEFEALTNREVRALESKFKEIFKS